MTETAQTSWLEFDDHGFALLDDNRKQETVEWDRVREIIAYRRDPEGKDLLCLGFRVTSSNDYIEIHEEMDEYQQLLDLMYDAFPKINRDWWQDIAMPLGSNRQTIYGISMAEQSQPAAAARYLLALKDRKVQARVEAKKLSIVTAFLFAMAWGQVLLGGWLDKFNPILAMCVMPFVLIFIIAKLWPTPKKLFALLLAYHLFELLANNIASSPCQTLAGKLIDGNLEYLLLLGAEILLGLLAMKLFQKRPAKKSPKVESL